MDLVFFYIFGAIAVLASIGVVGQRNPMHSVMLLIASFGALAGLYILLDSPFTAVTQIIVYAGAIMVLFLFVVMLLNVPREDAAEWDRTHPLYRPWPVRIGASLALLLVAQLVWALLRTPGIRDGVGLQSAGISDVGELGRVLFTDYMFAFEVTSILILASMVGAVILARRQSE